MQLLLIGVFGVCGIYARYFIDNLLQSDSYIFPIGIFTANCLGCFIAGIVYAYTNSNDYQSGILTTALLTGLCGGLTTFSGFNLEFLKLFQNSDYIRSFTYLLAGPLFGILMVLLGSSLFYKLQSN